MTPEERAVLDAAIRWAKFGGSGWAKRLQDTVQDLHISRQPEHAAESVPCGSANRGGTMRCELPRGHDPDAVRQLWHQGRAADGSRRVWREMLR